LKKKRDAEERRRYPLENRLKEAIIGQLGAINSVAAGKLSIGGFVIFLIFFQRFDVKKVDGLTRNIH
jgi:uncharacterized membrane protein YfcA